MKKILTVIGARPQFVKAAVLSRLFEVSACTKEILVHTGQHYDHGMSQVFFDEMNIPTPAYNLNIGSGGHGSQTGAMMSKIEDLVIKEKPDCLLVYGDTNSTLAGALVGAKLHIPVAHVEAGLRSFNKKMPEEINRICTDHVSSMLFCPTETAKENLLNEGFSLDNISISGDVMYDAVLYYQQRTSKEILKTLSVNPGEFILCTIHRAENTDELERMTDIVEALIEISSKIKVVLPLHPRTLKKLAAFDLEDKLRKSVLLIEPLGYLDMLTLEQECAIVATDSGGVQKEAYFFKKPCITMRDQTEWVELVSAGYNKITGAKKENILEAFDYFYRSEIKFKDEFYGAGNAGELIINELEEYLK